MQARRERILADVLDAGTVPIDVLAGRYEVSAMTVHRDLAALAADGYLAKGRGRAVAPSALTVQTSAVFRRRAARDLKRAVAAAALPLVQGARTVLVDDSTSALPLLRMMCDALCEPVTVVSNYVEVVRQIGTHPMVTVHLLGGTYVPHLDATFGPATVRAIAGWRPDVAVLSVPAVSGGRCYHTLEPSAAVKRAALDVSARSVLLLDHTKTPRTGPHLICGVDRFDVLVVDDAAAPPEVEAVRSAGTHVVLATDPRSEGTP